MSRKDLAKMRNQKQDKNSRQVDVYMFATSFSILDSILYVSDIQLVNDVTVNNKWFIKERLVFEKQFADFVTQVDKSKFAVQKALDEAQLLFDSLMQKYFG